MPPETRPRNTAALIAARGFRTFLGMGNGAGLVPTTSRLAQIPIVMGPSVNRSADGDEGGESAELESGSALTVAWTVPGAPSQRMHVAVIGTIGTDSHNGTAEMSVAGVRKPVPFDSGGGNNGDAMSAFVDGGSTITLIITPTFAGGGTVTGTLDFMADRFK